MRLLLSTLGIFSLACGGLLALAGAGANESAASVRVVALDEATNVRGGCSTWVANHNIIDCDAGCVQYYRPKVEPSVVRGLQEPMMCENAGSPGSCGWAFQIALQCTSY
jgi:hypothetical protein